MSDPAKKMGLVGLTTLVTVNMMGSGIIMLPASMAQIGAVSLLSWLVTAVGSMALSCTGNPASWIPEQVFKV